MVQVVDDVNVSYVWWRTSRADDQDEAKKLLEMTGRAGWGRGGREER